MEEQLAELRQQRQQAAALAALCLRLCGLWGWKPCRRGCACDA